jgi:hypothetical protein
MTRFRPAMTTITSTSTTGLVVLSAAEAAAEAQAEAQAEAAAEAQAAVDPRSTIKNKKKNTHFKQERKGNHNEKERAKKNAL